MRGEFAMEKKASDTWDLLTTDEAAEMLGLAKITLALWRRQKKGPPYIKIEGTTVRYKLKDLTKWLEKSRVTPVNSNRKD